MLLVPAVGGASTPSAMARPAVVPTMLYWGAIADSGPFFRANASATYFPEDSGYDLIFGGNGGGPGGGCSDYCNDSWALGESFYEVANLTPSQPSPSPRSHAGLVYDTELSEGLLFGGGNASGPLNDTWSYVGHGLWDLVPTPTAPSPRSDMVMVADPSAGGVLLFGGEGVGGQALGDTWLFNASGWHRLDPTSSPSPRWGAAAAYDPTTGSVLIFGGTNGPEFDNDTWAFQRGSWSPLNLGTSPPARADADLVVTGGGDPFLFGGRTASRFLNDSWTSLGGTWLNISNLNVGGPPPMSGAVLVNYAPLGPNLFWLLGGRTATSYDPKAWTLDIPWGGTLGNLSASITASVLSGRAPLQVTLTGTVAGGTPPYQESWDFGDGTGGGTGAQLTHTFASAGSFVVTLTVTDARGTVVQATSRIDVTMAPGPPPPRSPYPAWLGSQAFEVLVAGMLLDIGVVYALHLALERRRKALRFRRRLGDSHRDLPELAVGWMKDLARTRDVPGSIRGIRSDLRRWHADRREVGPERPGRWRGVGTWVARRILVAIPQVLVVLTIMYTVVSIVPAAIQGAPLSVTAAADGWWTFVMQLVTGQWGSVVTNSGSIPAMTYIQYFAGDTLEMGLMALGITVLLSYPVGLHSGWRRGGGVDTGSRAFSSFGVFFPSAVLALVSLASTFVLVAVLSGDYVDGSTGTLPSALWFNANNGGVPAWVGPYGNTLPTGIPILDALLGGDLAAAELITLKVLLGALIVALVYSAIYLRFARMATADVAEESHLTASRSRGVPEHDLLWTHTSRRILPIYISVFGTTFSSFIFILALVELIFNDSGIGPLALQGSGPLVDGLIFLLTLVIIIVNALADLAAQVLDPRWGTTTGGRA